MEDWGARLDKQINSVLLPVFSELDVFILVYFGSLFGLHHFNDIATTLREVVTEEIQTGNLKGLLGMGLVGLLVGYMFFLVIKQSISQRNWSVDEASMIGQIFYIAIGLLSISSYINGNYGFMTVGSLIAFLMLIRSVLMVILVNHFRKTRQDYKISERMMQTQASPLQLVSLVVIGGVIYVLLQQWYEVSTILLQGYFYTFLILQLIGGIEKLSKK